MKRLEGKKSNRLTVIPLNMNLKKRMLKIKMRTITCRPT